MKITTRLTYTERRDLQKQVRRRYSRWRQHSNQGRTYLAILFVLSGGRCPQCEKHMILTFSGEESKRLATLDHVDPIVKVLEHDKLNLKILCKGCNEEKGRTHDKTKKPA